MKAKELFKNLISQITVYDKHEAREIVFWLLEHYLGLSKIDVISNNFNEEKDINWQEIINRLNLHEPIQYILGETTFYGHKFLVNHDVLIPRPETEELVSLVIDSWQLAVGDKKNQPFTIHHSPITILDIGTGSGCIAISLAKEIPNSEVYAWDISEKALEIAKNNAELNNINVIFETKNILDLRLMTYDLRLNIIVSNPPYVTKIEAKKMRENVLNFEPHLALFVEDNNPLIFYESIANFALNHLIINGLVFLEINENFGKETAEVYIKKGFSEVKIIKDIHGKDRFLKAILL
jgi:release factor glutamine methyltransferase